MLFEEKIRDYSGYADHGESKYHFYDRSSKPEFSSVRNSLNDWYTHYPEDERYNLRSRIQLEFSEVFYEIFMHEIFQKLSYKSKIHPSIAGTNNKPDFLFYNDDIQLYIEAKLAIELDQSAREQDIENKVFQTITNIPNPNFFISIDSFKIKEGPYPSFKTFKTRLTTMLSQIDPDTMGSDYESLPIFKYSNDIFSISLTVLPRSLEVRRSESKLGIGATHIRTKFGDSSNTFQKAVLKKSGKYGKIESPLVIAINFNSNWGLHESDIRAALYGTKLKGLVYNATAKEYITEQSSVFIGPNGPQCKRISAVIITEVNPANYNKCYFKVFHNPFAIHPISTEVLPFDQVYVEDNRIVQKKGSGMEEIFER